MEPARIERRLAAILAADVAGGYSQNRFHLMNYELIITIMHVILTMPQMVSNGD